MGFPVVWYLMVSVSSNERIIAFYPWLDETVPNLPVLAQKIPDSRWKRLFHRHIQKSPIHCSKEFAVVVQKAYDFTSSANRWWISFDLTADDAFDMGKAFERDCYDWISFLFPIPDKSFEIRNKR